MSLYNSYNDTYGEPFLTDCPEGTYYTHGDSSGTTYVVDCGRDEDRAAEPNYIVIQYCTYEVIEVNNTSYLVLQYCNYPSTPGDYEQTLEEEEE